MKVLSVASEFYPLVKTGGLADVVGALPGALKGQDIEMRPFLPGYRAVMPAAESGPALLELADLFGGPAWIRGGKSGEISLLILDAPHLYDRPGNPYLGPDGLDWPDNAQRFAALAAAAALVARGAVAGFRPDIIHAHDWQAGLVAAYLHYQDGARPGVVMTVHNIAYQGQFSADLLAMLGLPPEALSIDGVAHHGQIGYLKAGLQLADRVTTVSPGYAAELLSAKFGMGFEGLFRARAGIMSGILNGIDEDIWNPATDPQLAASFDAKHLRGRARNKAAVQERMALKPDQSALLFGIVSRLVWQKGIDLVLASVPSLLACGAQLAVLGTGEPAIEAALRDATARHSGRIGCVIGFDEGLSHLMQAGVDALLVPSRFEPCGLTQLYALRYGAIPVVARVGGLADTVIDANPMALAAGVATGVQFSNPDEAMLQAAIRRTAGLWQHKPAWRQMQRNAMASDVSWHEPARQYAALYRSLQLARALI
jgi:starch synthase